METSDTGCAESLHHYITCGCKVNPPSPPPQQMKKPVSFVASFIYTTKQQTVVQILMCVGQETRNSSWCCAIQDWTLNSPPILEDTHLVKRGLFEGLWSPLHHGMQRLEHSKHALDVALTKVKTWRLFKALVPHLVPQDRHSDKLLTHLDEEKHRWKGQTAPQY